MDREYFTSMIKTSGWLAILWVVTISYSFLAFALQVMLLKGCPTNVIICLQHITQSIMFICCMITVWRTEWVYSHYLFAGMYICVIFFKMHSYTVSNINYREEYLEKLRKGIKINLTEYPNNITLKNFITYLAMPTFIYKSVYPRSNNKFSIKYFLNKFIIAILLIVNYIHNNIDKNLFNFYGIYFPSNFRIWKEILYDNVLEACSSFRNNV